MTKAKKSPAKTTGVEGEGSYSATHHYNDGVKQTIDSGKVDQLAQKAKDALEGPEAEELARAERTAKKGPPAKGAGAPKSDGARR